MQGSLIARCKGLLGAEGAARRATAFEELGRQRAARFTMPAEGQRFNGMGILILFILMLKFKIQIELTPT